MTVETWLVFTLVCLLPVISPGPAILLAVGNTLRFGRQATVYSAAGNALGLFLLGIAVAYGLGSLMTMSAAVFFGIKLIGAGYLIFLGLKVLFRRGMFTPAASSSPADLKPKALFFEAFLVAVTNPKPILVFAALFPQFLTPDAVLWSQIILLSGTYASLCLINHLLLAACASRVRAVLMTERGARWVRRVLGSAFLGFGGALAASAR